MSDSDWVDDDADWVDDNHGHANDPSMLESALRGAAQGATLGFADEATGALESLFSKKPYKQARDESRANYDAASEANPLTYGAGELGGGLPLAFVPGVGAAEDAGLAKSALQALGLGGTAGAGSSNANDIAGIAADAGKGALIGGVVGSAAHAASPYLESATQKLASGTGDIADRFAAKALGAERGTIKSLGYDKVKQAGRQALDEGVLSPLASTDDLISRNDAIKSRGGQMMGKAYDAIDDAGASSFSPLQAAQSVDEKIGDFYRSPINRGETNQLDNTLESIMMRNGSDAESIPLRDAQNLKKELGKVANWKNNLNITDKEKMAREAYGIVSDHIDDAVANGSEAIDKAGLTDLLNQGKELYSNSSTADKLLQNKQAREEGNKILGITDWGILGSGAAAAPLTGGASLPITMAATATKKGFEKYGAQNAALGLDKVSKALMKSPQMAELFNKNPTVFNAIAQKMEGHLSNGMNAADNDSKPFEPTALIQKVNGTPYAQTLQSAAQRGDKALSVTHFILQSKDPKYRELTLGEENDQE